MITSLLHRLDLKFLCCFLIIAMGNCKHNDVLAEKMTQQITAHLADVMAVNGIPGLSLAVIQDDKVIYRNDMGVSSIEHQIAVDSNTAFRVFSTTKLITATAIFQLVEDGRLNVDDYIAKYIDNLPKHWHGIKIEHLLTHSSGLPHFFRNSPDISNADLINAMATDDMQFDAGEQFQYNQTNYWLLSLIIENITRSDFESFVRDRQFVGSQDHAYFSSDSKMIIPNRSRRYYFNNKNDQFDIDTTNNTKRAHSGNGLNITLNEFIQWNDRLDHGGLIQETTKNEMWKPFPFNNDQDNFLHGWGTYQFDGVQSIGFTGGNLSAFRKFKELNTTIILLSNGYKIGAYDMIVNDIARMVLPSLKDQGLALEHDVVQNMVNKDFTTATEIYKRLKQSNQNVQFDNLRSSINGYGNYLTAQDKLEDAVRIYELNESMNPDWWIGPAALAEGYDAIKQNAKAITYYGKAIPLNVSNQYGYNEVMQKRIQELKDLKE